ncbi:MAG: type I-E CRISPR-associated protein Cse2/CasB [Bacteroidota bacterium]
MQSERRFRFIDYLYSLDPVEDRDIFAAFRRGLGKPPGDVYEMYRYIYVPKVSPWIEKVCFMVASLFSLHPAPGGNESLGVVMARLAQKVNGIVQYNPKDRNIGSIERRFLKLLSCHPDDLFEQLAHIVTLIKANNIPIDWNDLYWSLCRWNKEETRNENKKRWTRDFYRELQK